MLRFVLKRLALTVPLALGVLTLTFALLESAPGNPSDLLIGARPIPQEVRERIERAYGFDRPPAERYLRWLAALTFHGELGWSHSRGKTVAAAIGEALPPTIALAGTALALHVVIGVLLGIVSAAKRGRWPDRVLTLASLTLYAMPTFWLALMAVLALSYWIPIFPTSSLRSVGAENWSLGWQLLDRLWHLALPAFVLGLASAAAMTRFVRAGLIQALGQEFARAARARGVGGRRMLLVHALRNSMIPVVNLVGLSLPVLFSGSLVTEVIFAWPGMGRLTYDAILADDISVVLVTTLLATLMVVVGNLAADLAMVAVDPRIRLEARRSGS